MRNRYAEAYANESLSISIYPNNLSSVHQRLTALSDMNICPSTLLQLPGEKEESVSEN